MKLSRSDRKILALYAGLSLCFLSIPLLNWAFITPGFNGCAIFVGALMLGLGAITIAHIFVYE